MKRTVLNIPALVYSLLALALLGAGVFGVHRWQLSRIAAGLLTHAQTFEDHSEWHKAAEFLDRYLRIQPADAPVRGRLALTYARGADSPEDKQLAVALCYRAIGAGHAPDESQLRTKLSELLIETGRFLEAEQEAQKLLDVDANNPAAQRALALALFAQLQAGAIPTERLERLKLVSKVEVACGQNPADVDLVEIASTLYREHAALVRSEDAAITEPERLERADAHLDELILRNPASATAYLARYRYRMRYGLAEADLDLKQALDLGPQDSDVLLTAAFAALRQGQTHETNGEQQEAAEQFQYAVELFENLVNKNDRLGASAEPHLGLGDSFLKCDQLDRAIQVWREGLRRFTQPSVQASFHGRIADALIEADRVSEADESLAAIDDILAKVGGTISADAHIALQRAQDLRRASLALRREQYQAALPFLQRVVSRDIVGTEGRDVEFYAWSQLGRAWAALHDWTEAALAFDRATTLQPQAIAPRLAAANAWFNASRPELAVDRAEVVVAAQSSHEAWLLLAAAHLQAQIRLPTTERNWDRLEAALQALGQAPADSPLAWRTDLLRAEYLSFRGRTEGDATRGRQQAKETLDQAAVKYSSSQGFLAQLVIALEGLEFAAEADRVLKQMKAQNLPAVDIALAEARLYVRRKDYPRAKATLEAVSRIAGSVDQLRLRREYLGLAEAAGDVPQVTRLLDAELASRPGDLQLLRQRCELAIDQQDFKSLPQLQAKLAAAGSVGNLWAQYYGVVQLYSTAGSAGDNDQLQAALVAQESLAAARPNWPPALLLRGMIEERLGNWEEAATAYESTIELGLSQTSVFERLIAVLERLNRPADAEKYLSRLESQLPFSQTLTEFASGRELLRNPNRAVAIAREAVAKRPDDVAARVWLGRLLLLNKQFPEAEQEFRTAIEASNDVRAWNGLFSFFLRMGETEKARETLAELAVKVKLEPTERDFVVAQGLERLGDWEAASAKYRAAADQSPQNALIQLRLAGLYLRSDPDQAISCLRKALQWDPKLAPARRMLAALLASRGTEAELNEAEALLSQEVGPNASVPVEDRRLRALLLAQHGTEENTTRAIQLLEEIVARGTGALPGDHLVLAQLYEYEARKTISMDDAAARLKAARQQLVTVATRDEPHANHVIALVEFLLRQGLPAEATPWLEKLESLIPGDSALMARLVELRTKHGSFAECEPWLVRIAAEDTSPLRVVMLRAKLLAAQSKLAEATACIEPKAAEILNAAADDPAKVEIAKTIGDFYAGNTLHERAEAWYRRLADLDPKQFPLVVMAVARQNRAQDAIELCLQHGQQDKSSRYAIVAAAILSELSPPAEVRALATPLVQTALQDFPQDLNLLYSVATCYIVEERYEEAVDILRKIIAINPRHVAALNNLALILAETSNKRQEALTLIDQAIAVVGPHPGLLDTKGAILVYDGKSQQALPLLEVAARGTQVDPRHNLHLAAAYRDLAQGEQARDRLQLALDRDLERLILTRTDQTLLEDLRSKLGL